MTQVKSPPPVVSPPAKSATSGRWQWRTVYGLSVAGAMGAVVGLYAYGEAANVSDALAHRTSLWWARNVVAGITIGGAIGLFLNAAERLGEGSWPRLARAMSWGAAAGALGGACGLLVGELVLGGLRGGLIGRATAWAIMGLGIGLSQGAASRSRQRLIYGILGGMAGGWVGGFLFELLRERLGSGDDPARSQGPGIVLLGAGIGLCLALVEQALRRAWVVVAQGRQEGRAYLLGSSLSRLGLDEWAEVGLFGDPEVARRHAEIERTPDGYLLHDRDGQGRTRVNGEVIQAPKPLHDGDRIILGRTSLIFHERGQRSRDVAGTVRP
jgi:hypothetical protein